MLACFSLFVTSNTYIKLLKQVIFLMTFIVLPLQVHVNKSFFFLVIYLVHTIIFRYDFVLFVFKVFLT